MDEASTRANKQLAEFRVLLDLTAERLWDLQRNFLAMQSSSFGHPAELPRCLLPGWLLRQRPMAKQRASTSRRTVNQS